MSAQEIIEQIKALPPRDKAAVVEFTRTLDASPNGGVRYVDESEAERLSKKIFDEHEELFRKLAQ